MSIRVAVIGAGAAGLCAVRHLASRPQTFSVTAFELSNKVGGTWVYTDKVGHDSHGLPIHSSMYRNLKTNLPKEVMAFPDFPFDERLPSYVKHDDVRQYLDNYATHFNLHQYIKFRTEVVKVQPKPCSAEESRTGLEQKWEVTSEPVLNRNQSTTEEYDAVIVCNGHYSIPLIPEIEGLETFEGEIIHSHNYRFPEHFQNKRVVCLGAAASGQDISLDLASSAQMVYLCHNKPRIQSPLPPNVKQEPGIRRIQGSSFTLNDGSLITVDCLMFCTGYRFTFPFLTDSCHLHTEDERITPLYKHLIHTEFPTLSFIGICKMICPFPQFHVQVQLVLAVLDGSHKLPSSAEMDADTEADFQRRLSEGLPARYAHTMGGRQWAYNDDIACMAGCERIPKAVHALYDSVHASRAVNLQGYKDVSYEWADGGYNPAS